MSEAPAKKIKQEALDAALSVMTNAESPALYDVTIICTTDDHQAEYWTKRLSEGVCRAPSSSAEGGSSPFPMVLAVSEDWSAGGAGNGLGTLYAYQKAARAAEEKHGVDLAALLRDKTISAALYHTAGKGTRLAPLPASENNNKPGVKLPVCHELSDGSFEPMTVLEAVVKQTGIYAASRKGRLSVYWGDQVFIPSAAFSYTPTHHVDIMCTLLGDTAPTAEEWAEQGLDKYGVIAVSKGVGRDAAQVEKVDHATAVKMLQSLGDIGQVGPSLGSFSVSAPMLEALCGEYSTELAAKAGKFDTDPHFWMPLTLPEEAYVSLMGQKGVDAAEAKAHHERMTKMKAAFDLNGMGLFGAVDVGSEAAWWDYGQLKLYYKNNISLTDFDDETAKLYRRFLGVKSPKENSSIGSDVKIDDKSCVFSSTVQSGTISDSVLASVAALSVEAKGAIIVNCTAKSIKAGKNAILYNIVDDSDEGIVAADGDVIVSVTEEDGSMMELRSKHSICGGQAWKKVLDGNTMSFEQMHGKNKEANVSAIEKTRKNLHKQASASFGL
mmetsp:Transcript_33120/g.73022  ORF Transcript_33120/g.73022 Transcript_33120/m.73022 type:complete len:552 (+) Transcript_33120:78-1733(+)